MALGQRTTQRHVRLKPCQRLQHAFVVGRTTPGAQALPKGELVQGRRGDATLGGSPPHLAGHHLHAVVTTQHDRPLDANHVTTVHNARRAPGRAPSAPLGDRPPHRCRRRCPSETRTTPGTTPRVHKSVAAAAAGAAGCGTAFRCPRTAAPQWRRCGSSGPGTRTSKCPSLSVQGPLPSPPQGLAHRVGPPHGCLRTRECPHR
jgi:hypothetical protein